MNRFLRHRLAAGPAAAILAGVVACADVNGPMQFGDPARYVLATPASFLCRQWYPARPAAEYGLFDVYYARQDTAPPADAIDLVVRAGGAVVAPFHLDGLRAILPIGAVPYLQANVARSVTDPAMLYHEVLIGFVGAPDSALVTAHGGRVLHVYDITPFVYASVPDSALPALRADPRVTAVEFNGIMCLDDALVPEGPGQPPVIVLQRP
jgi:hypothetical protein